MEIKERLDLVEKLVRLAGIELNNVFHKMFREQAGIKADQSFVTEQDTKTEDFLISEIRKVFPDDGFVGEEGSDTQGSSGFRWVIDPIDGTTNFVLRFPIYTISVALMKGHDIVAGTIYVPAIDKTYSVKQGEGFCTEYNTCSVSSINSIGRSALILSIAHKPHLINITTKLYSQLLPQVNKLRITGSIAYDIAQVASGLFDAVVGVGCSEWDVAAGVLMAREAGAKVLDFYGNEWQASSPTILVTNRYLVDQYLEILKPFADFKI